LAQGFDLVGKAAAHLLHGHLMGCCGFGRDEVGHGFGLRQVELTVQEGAEGKFPLRSNACALLDEQLDDLLLDELGAVAGNFDGVFAGIRVGRFKKTDEYFVQYNIAIVQHTEMDGVGFFAFEPLFFQVFGGKNAFADGNSVGTG